MEPGLGDRRNRRGDLLLGGLYERGLGVLPLSEPTRLGHMWQQDTFVDLIITNATPQFSPVSIGVCVSDHRILDCFYTIHVSKCSETLTRRFDFRRTYDIFSDNLGTYFDGIDWFAEFGGNSLDSLGSVFNSVVLKGWEDHGIYKFVNSSSRPWFTPHSKQLRRDSRFWERKIKKFISRGVDGIIARGVYVSFADCITRRDDAIRLRFNHIEEIKNQSISYINNLLSHNIFSTVRCIYHSKHRCITCATLGGQT